LYLATLSIDGIRKVEGLPASTIGIIYIITAFIYVLVLPRAVGRSGKAPKTLPLWLLMLSGWSLIVALMEHIPAEFALLGWTSYVFFVPLAYVGAELAADDGLAAKVMRVVTLGGAAVGAFAVISAVLGESAPALLQPIVPAVGVHSFNNESIYISPSVFATAEEASEQLLISLFAWVALARLGTGGFRRIATTLLGALIITGLLFTARRADLYVAMGGVAAVVIAGQVRKTTLNRRRPAGGLARMSMADRSGMTLLLAVAGSAALLFLLGDGTLRSFLVSGSAAQRVSSGFALTRSGSLLGQGPGTSTQGILALAPVNVQTMPDSTVAYVLNGRTFAAAEGGLGKVWLELGIIGVTLYAAVFGAAFSPALRVLRRMDGAGISLVALACATGMIFLKNHQSLDDPLIQPLFWLAVGGIWGRARNVLASAHDHPALHVSEAAPSSSLG
jgi:hypothetical protein